MIPRGLPPPPPPPPPPLQQQQQQQRRKKWTEEEERALIDKYASMAADGSLARLRTRERRFRPIAEHVNSQHHAADPAAFPFAWSWKDASTKVQNMRHQFLLVKQKLLSATPLLPHQSDSSPHHHPALSLWPNFLHYRDVFGDAPLPLKPPSDPSAAAPLAETQNLEEELGDEAEAEAEAEAETPARSRGKKRRRRREAAEERRRRRWEKEEEEEREREREWEERIERRRAEWRKRADDAARQHRAEMEHIHARIVHDHHAFLNHLLGFFSNWVGGGGGGGGGGVSDGVGGAAQSPGNHHNHNSSHHSNQYMSQMMQGLHQVNGTVPEEENPTTTTEDGHEDQFIVD